MTHVAFEKRVSRYRSIGYPVKIAEQKARVWAKAHGIPVPEVPDDGRRIGAVRKTPVGGAHMTKAVAMTMARHFR